jgi:hypothetical protein
MVERANFLKGAALGRDRFVAAGPLLRTDGPDEPDAVGRVWMFSTATGWNSHVVRDTTITGLAAFQGRGLVLTIDGDLLDAATGNEVANLAEPLITTFAAIATNEAEIFVAASDGYYLRSDASMVFRIMTDQTIVTRPAYDAPRAEKRAYMDAYKIITNIAVSPEGTLAMTELAGEFMTLSRRGTVASYTNANRLSEVIWDDQTGAFWTCGHSPFPSVAVLRDGQLSMIWQGAKGLGILNTIALHDGTIYLGDEDEGSGGLYQLIQTGAPPSSYRYEQVAMPAMLAQRQVRKLVSVAGVLWVLRDHDLLRLANGQWDVFAPPP